MLVTILRRRWNLLFVPQRSLGPKVEGKCDDPSTPSKTIQVSRSLTGERRLDVLIHEMLHAADWHKDEEWISTVASDIARALWRQGYRGPNDVA